MFNAFRTELQIGIGGAALEIATEMGTLVTYQHRNDAPIQVYTMPQNQPDMKMREWSNTRSREMPRTFNIPLQLDAGGSGMAFPPSENPMIDDIITDEYGFTYVIREVNNDDLNMMYTFPGCICTTVKQIGAVGQ